MHTRAAATRVRADSASNPPVPPNLTLLRSTVPFVAKAVGHPIAKYASLLMSGNEGWKLETHTHTRATPYAPTCVC
jgi:hypothetical protein